MEINRVIKINKSMFWDLEHKFWKSDAASTTARLGFTEIRGYTVCMSIRPERVADRVGR